MDSRRIWAFEQGVLWALDSTGGAPAFVSPRIAVHFAEVHNETVEVLVNSMGLPDPKPVRQRLNSGRRCFAGWVDNQIAVYGWVSHKAECIGELEREIQLAADEAYIWDCLTLPAYRRQRLYSALLSYLVAELRREGVRRIWIGSSMVNQPSIRGFVNAGFRQVISLTYVRFWGLCFVRLAGHPDAPGELVAAARQALIAPHERSWGSIIVGQSQPAQALRCAQIEA